MESCTTQTSIVVPSPGKLGAPASFVVGSEKVWEQIYKCMLDAHGDCGRVSACLAPGASSRSCDPAADLARASCQDDVVTGCTADGQTVSIACSSHQAVCVGASLIGAPINVCGVGRCPATAAELKCRGNAREVCLGDALLLADCAALGLRCEVSDGGEPQCVGQTCGADFAAKCEGDVAISCVAGVVNRLDCATNPAASRCDTGLCVRSGRECNDQADACSGSKLTFCRDGFKREVDCVGAGFRACSAGVCVAP